MSLPGKELPITTAKTKLHMANDTINMQYIYVSINCTCQRVTTNSIKRRSGSRLSVDIHETIWRVPVDNIQCHVLRNFLLAAVSVLDRPFL